MNRYTFDEICIGQTETFDVQITEEMMNSFQKITGDINPLHCDEKYAQENNYSGRVCYGMLISSFYSTLAGVYLPGEFSLLLSVDAKMNNPVFIGDVLTVSGTVSEKHDSVFKLIEVKATIRNQNNKKVSSAKLNIGVRDSSNQG